MDDEIPFLEQTKIFLEKEDDELDIYSTDSPEEALKMIPDDFDAVVSDYQMPTMDGLEFLKNIRETSDIPFIMFTGRGREEVAIKALNLGADRYIQKGGDPRSQYGVLAQAIGQEVQHHRTKRMMRKLSEELQQTFDAIEHPIFLLDTDHRILRTNEAAEEFFSEGEDELVGRFCHEVAHGSDEPIDDCPMERTLETEKVEQIEFYSEGSDKYFLARTNPIMGEDGEIEKVVHQEIDITDLKKKESELKEKKMMFESIFNDPDRFIGILDPDGKLSRANDSSLDFVDISMAEVEGELFWNTPWWRHSPELRDKLKDAIKGAARGDAARFKASHIGKDGRKAVVDFSLRPVYDDQGCITKLIAEGKDLTEIESGG